MKFLPHILFAIFFSHALVASDNSWKLLPQSVESFCEHHKVRVSVPVNMEPADNPILVVFSWTKANRIDEDSDDTQILTWEKRLDKLLVSEEIGFHFASSCEGEQLRSFYYVSDIEMLRYLSHKAGELFLDAEATYRFVRDDQWAEWETMKGIPGNHLLANNEDDDL